MAVTTELVWHLLKKKPPTLKEQPGIDCKISGVSSNLLIFRMEGGIYELGNAHRYLDESEVTYVTVHGHKARPIYWAELTTPFNT